MALIVCPVHCTALQPGQKVQELPQKHRHSVWGQQTWYGNKAYLPWTMAQQWKATLPDPLGWMIRVFMHLGQGFPECMLRCVYVWGWGGLLVTHWVQKDFSSSMYINLSLENNYTLMIFNVQIETGTHVAYAHQKVSHVPRLEQEGCLGECEWACLHPGPVTVAHPHCLVHVPPPSVSHVGFPPPRWKDLGWPDCN